METHPPEAPVNVPAAPVRRWQPARFLARAVAEIAIIFLGITLSFAFDEWRTTRRNRAEEQQLLLALRRDLRIKLTESEQDLRGIGYWRESLTLMDSLRTATPRAYFANIQVYLQVPWYWDNRQPGIVDFLEGGKSQLVADSSLRRQLLEDYLFNSQKIVTTYEAINAVANDHIIPLLAQEPALATQATLRVEGGGSPNEKWVVADAAAPASPELWNWLRIQGNNYRLAQSRHEEYQRMVRRHDSLITAYLGSYRFN